MLGNSRTLCIHANTRRVHHRIDFSLDFRGLGATRLWRSCTRWTRSDNNDVTVFRSAAREPIRWLQHRSDQLSCVELFRLRVVSDSHAMVIDEVTLNRACDLRALRRLTGSVSEAHPGRTHVHPKQTLCGVTFHSTGPSASRNTFPVSTITDSYAQGREPRLIPALTWA